MVGGRSPPASEPFRPPPAALRGNGPAARDLALVIAGPLVALGCRVEADSDLGAIGDVHLIAHLQSLDEGPHSRVLHVDSVGPVRAGEGDAASVGCCRDDGYARSGVDAASIRCGLRRAGRPVESPALPSVRQSHR